MQCYLCMLSVCLLCLGTGFEACGANFVTLKSFPIGTGGLPQPASGLIQATDGVLYGTTEYGGAHGFGSVFKVNRDGSGYTILHSFGQSPGGETPFAGLLEGSDGALYGVTPFRAPSDPETGGAIFKLNKDGSGFVLLHRFGDTVGDGQQPQAGLMRATDGVLYGTTGGTTGSDENASGTVFKLNQDGSAYAVIHRFTGTDGADPLAELTEAADGALYGTTAEGGTSGAGVVFKLNKDGTGFKVLHHFAYDTDGRFPAGSLIIGGDGALYGTALMGGLHGNNGGTLFKLQMDGTGFQVIHSFGAPEDGSFPRGKLCFIGSVT